MSGVRIPKPPPASNRAVRATMKGNRRTDTKPEIALRSALHTLGLRFRKDFRLDLGASKVRPDIVFTRAKVAVFVDGCYWHSCPTHGRRSGGQNDDYWSAKLARNVERDREQDQALHEAGWMILRIWEHEVPSEAARTVHHALAKRRKPGGSSASKNPTIVANQDPVGRPATSAPAPANVSGLTARRIRPRRDA